MAVSKRPRARWHSPRAKWLAGGVAAGLTYSAVSNTCAHAGGPIGDGSLDGTTVTCPYHGWSYDVRTGACFVNEDMCLDTYEVKVVDDTVCIRIAG